MILAGRAAIGTTAFAASVAFYARLLACDPVRALDRFAQFDVPGLRLAIFQPRQRDETLFTNSEPGSGLCLCFDVTSLEDTLARLGECIQARDAINATPGGRESYVYDPDGNRVILFEPDASYDAMVTSRGSNNSASGEGA